MCVSMCVPVHATAHMKTSENNFMELILSFHFYMGCGEQTPDGRYARQMPVPAEPSLWPQSFIYFCIMLIINSQVLSKYPSC